MGCGKESINCTVAVCRQRPDFFSRFFLLVCPVLPQHRKVQALVIHASHVSSVCTLVRVCMARCCLQPGSSVSLSILKCEPHSLTFSIILPSGVLTSLMPEKPLYYSNKSQHNGRDPIVNHLLIHVVPALQCVCVLPDGPSATATLASGLSIDSEC